MKKIFVLASIAAVLSACGGDDKETTTKTDDTPVNVEVKSVGELTMAYYEMDSISTGFTFYVETMKVLETKKKNLETKLAGQQSSYESTARAYQTGLQANTLSANQAAGYEEKLRGIQQKIMEIEQTEGIQLEQEMMSANNDLMNKIDSYGKTYCEKHGIKMLLSKGKGGQVVYMDPTFDKTSEFINYMNTKESEINSSITE
jgi:Skp family chaperone for outer membrane proteins